MKTEGIPNQKGNPNEHKPSLKERAAYQLGSSESLMAVEQR